MKKFCIIDLDNMAHRMRHGAFSKPIWASRPFDPFHDPTDEETEEEMLAILLHQIMAGIINAYNMIKPDHVVLAFDRKSWRKDVFPAYKTRDEDDITPKELLEKKVLHRSKEILYDFFNHYTNVTVLAADWVEADDFIARWIYHHEDDNHVVVSSDSDFRQLISDTVSLFDPMGKVIWTSHGAYFQPPKKRKGPPTGEEIVLYNQEWVPKLDKTGEPENVDAGWLLFEKIIRGDKSDTIPAAYPRVRIDKIKAAYYGDIKEFNNFINSSYGKGEYQFQVKPLFDRNRELIDLSQQPQHILELMDETILSAIEREPAKMVGAYFSKLCTKYKLTKIATQASKFVDMMAKKY